MDIHNEANHNNLNNPNGGNGNLDVNNQNKVLYEKTSDVYGLGVSYIVFSIEDKK
jgi:hypothetical protein